MLRLLRTLLICWLVLALPAQGVMAATMVFCGPDHHDRASAVAAAQDADAMHHVQHAAAHAHAAAADEAAADHKFAQSDLQKCSVCAACCSAAAIHDTVPKLPVFEPVAADFAFVAPHVAPFAADGPDRPPRRLLA
jgi:hypothetical protein